VKLRFIKASIKGPIAVITLNRPSHDNCVNADLAFELKEACQQVEHNERVRVLIVTGAGKAFSSGRQSLTPRTDHDLEAFLEGLQCSAALSSLTRPTIAAINGDATDHGLELALACDLRVAADSAKMGFTDLDQGIIPWDGGTQRLVRLVGKAKALDLLLSRRLVNASDALVMGLVNRVEPGGKDALKSAMALAKQIAEAAPIAVRYTKEAVLRGGDVSLQHGLKLEADLGFLLQTTVDRKRGVESFLSKRKPRFSGR
jgi:enoyl-CoA hydratase/carnithine racemase